MKIQKENVSRLTKERDVAAKLRRNPTLKNSLVTNSHYSIIASKKEARLNAQKEREERAKSNTLEDKSESTKHRRSRLLKEKNRIVPVTEVIDKKISKKEPKLKSKTEPKNRSQRRIKSRRAGKIKVDEESSTITRVRYDKTKNDTNAIVIKDSVEIRSIGDTFNIADRRKREVSSRSFNLNKVRNNKPVDTYVKHDSKEAISTDSRKGVLVTVKKEKKLKVASLNSLAKKSKPSKKSKKIDKNKEVVTNRLELVTGVSKIEAISRDVAIKKNENSLKPTTVFSLSTMVPHVISTVDSLQVKQISVVINVIATYERIAKKGYKSVDLFQKIADSYFYKGDMETAVRWYEKLFDLTEKLDTIYYYRFGTALQKVGKAAKSEKMIKKFRQLQK